MATATKVYPIRGYHAPGVPHIPHELPSKKDAQVLLDTGAFTDNPNHPDRLPDSEIHLPVDEPVTTSEVEGLRAAGLEVPGEEPAPTLEERIDPEPSEPAETAEAVVAESKEA